MKKILCLLLVCLLLLCSCGNEEDAQTQQSTTTNTPQSSTTAGGVSADPTGTTSATTGTMGAGNTATQNGSTTSAGGTTAGITSPTKTEEPACQHKDDNNDEVCDVCRVSVWVTFDFYNINDLHGKMADTSDNIGVDELTTYLKNARKNDKNAIFLSTGDMWQGSSESNSTYGKIVVDWMNELDFAAMAIGNHEFDWGENYISSNENFAEFPFLAINIYDRKTNALADFCSPSVMIEEDGIQIGIIGAIGDCYSSIAVDKCDDVYFKVGKDLTALVKNESERLRKQGADFIVYLMHEGHGNSTNGSLSSSQMASYYDVSLSNGYIDLVFEGHTHQGYRIVDEYGVYHLQNRGDNKGGISHAEISINSVTMKHSVNTAEMINKATYQFLDDDPLIQQLLDKYAEQIAPSNKVLGYNSYYRNSNYLNKLIAQLYCDLGLKEWGDKYKIVLGGGFINARSPYNLPTGEVTYGDLQALYPFDNQIVLCSISGYNLRRKFLETNNDRYFISCSEYGESIQNNINSSATYYVIVDSYTSEYAYNGLTVIDRYDPNVFARDLLAEYIKEGGLAK